MPGPRYVRVLRRTGVARLVAPTLIARIPDAIAGPAIIVVARSVTGSYSAAGLAGAVIGALRLPVRRHRQPDREP
jgi:hypothetical protein